MKKVEINGLQWENIYDYEFLQNPNGSKPSNTDGWEIVFGINHFGDYDQLIVNHATKQVW